MITIDNAQLKQKSINEILIANNDIDNIAKQLETNDNIDQNSSSFDDYDDYGHHDYHDRYMKELKIILNSLLDKLWKYCSGELSKKLPNRNFKNVEFKFSFP